MRGMVKLHRNVRVLRHRSAINIKYYNKVRLLNYR